MSARRDVSVSLALSAFLLGCASVIPGPARAGSGAARPTRTEAAATSADIALPDGPPASVTIHPEDLSPGNAARAALSRLVVEPGVVLKAYAPLNARRPVPQAAPPPSRAVPASAPLPSADRKGAPPPSSIAAAAARAAKGIPPSTDGLAAPPPERVSLASPDLVPASAAVPAAEMPLPRPDTGRTAVVPDAAKPVPRAAVPPASDMTAAIAPVQAPADRTPPPPAPANAPATTVPAASEPSGGTEPAVLDAAGLRDAVERFVGPEPVAPASAEDQARRRDRQAVAAAYADRGFAPFWVENGTFTAKARSALARIDHAAEDGLDLRAFPVSVPRGGAAALARAELAVTQAVVAYGRQASGARIDPSRLAPTIAALPEVADPARILFSVSEALDPGEALRNFNPPHAGYAALRDKLAELRRKSDMAARGPIPYGPILKPGMRDARVPLIRARFGLGSPSDTAEAEGLVYDTRVAAAVADFQRSRGMPASGVLTIRTIAALSGGNPRGLENEIVGNMERWRWLPRDLGDTRIEVNVPDFTLDVKRGDAVVHHARVVVGKPDHQTPLFSQAMQFIIVNPYWNVPLSIVKKEMMPKLAAEPNYFADHGYEVVERNGVTFVRQPPGDGNALGHIKFMFPNKYSVYLHDTNARSLFGNDRRAMSHGCVRVDQPFKLAEVVLGADSGWTEARVKRLVGGNERTINLPRPVPVHIMYFTAFVDPNGVLRLRDDVYGYSAKVKAALGLEG